MTISQRKGKGKLYDILEAIEIDESHIEIEESPIMQSIEITKALTKKKSKRAKKFDFTQEESGFVLKPRKPVTRSQHPIAKYA